MDLSVSPKDEIWFLRMCHHISTGLYHRTAVFNNLLNLHVKSALCCTTISLFWHVHIPTTCTWQSPSCNVNNCSASKQLPALTKNFDIVITRTLHWTLSRARWIQSTPSRSISFKPIVILSSHLHPGLPNVLCPSGFHTNILHIIPFPPTRATFPAHPILSYFLSLLIFGPWPWDRLSP
jgi:hypothetical protein